MRLLGFHCAVDRAATVMAALGVVVALAGCSTRTETPSAQTAPTTSATTSATTSTTTVPTVSPDRLDAILLTGEEANALMGAVDLKGATAIVHAPDNSGKTVSNPDCLGARWPAQDPVYQGSGYTAISAIELDEHGDQNSATYVQQAVATFPSADRALAFVQSSAAKWKSCAGQNVIATGGDQTSRWSFGDVVGDAPKISQFLTKEAGRGLACQHALTAVSNVVIDVQACGYHISDQGREIADKMAAKASE